jgi:hypothetical protein
MCLVDQDVARILSFFQMGYGMRSTEWGKISTVAIFTSLTQMVSKKGDF